MSRLTTYCHVHTCPDVADDEYHYDDVDGRHVWLLCDDHLQLAIEMVECVGEVIDSKESFSE